MAKWLAGVGILGLAPFEQWDITPLFKGEPMINPYKERVIFLEDHAVAGNEYQLSSHGYANHYTPLYNYQLSLWLKGIEFELDRLQDD